ncbi:hypothetical protein [Colwellia psychrerythraea]|uniref:EF hand domain protein n=1 Tax=Colwellia psychrerythraea (strain 34H / ATCC BAA-681) TaxID=167879 RepID=Q482E0_COLP3|nr:hypothetical protein [Colwellia psychrerythraea]AAZ26532.1 EF hand domain protein [Colwellia psychrerythraea 34H]
MKKLNLIPFALFLIVSFNSQAGKQEYFNKIDIDQNQVLDKSEFSKHMKKYLAKQSITDKTIQNKKVNNGFKRKDSNSDGQLNFAEFSSQK